MGHATTPDLSRRAPALVLAVACLPVFVGALDLTIVSAVLPTVIFDLRIPLQTGLDDATWMVTGYLLTYAVSMMVMGRVSDLVGRRRVFLIALAVFFVGSWWVAASDGAPARWAYSLVRTLTGDRPDRGMMALYALIAGRMVQAFGAGAMVPVCMALASDLYPPERRVAALGVVAAVDTLGWVLGHLYGGIMVQVVSWQTLFWLNLPITALVFALLWGLLRGTTPPRAAGGVDLPGTALATLALLSLNVGLGSNQATATSGLGLPDASPPYAGPMIVAAVGLTGLFVWVERRVSHPLLNVRLLAERSVGAAIAANLLAGFAMMVGLVSVPLLINAVGAETSQQVALVSGYLLAAFTVPMALAAYPGGLLSRRVGQRAVACGGLAVAALGFVLMSRWQLETARQVVEWILSIGTGASVTGAAWGALLGMISGPLLAGAGLGMTMAPIAAAVINAAQDSERGMASALVIILRLVGMTVSVSALTTYGLRRSGALLQEAGDLALDADRLAALAQEVTSRVTAEVAIVGAVVCLGALLLSLRLRPALTSDVNTEE